MKRNVGKQKSIRETQRELQGEKRQGDRAGVTASESVGFLCVL